MKRIRPLILEGHPPFLGDGAGDASLLLLPLGSRTLIEHLAASLKPLTGSAPLLVVGRRRDDAYAAQIGDACPSASVVTGAAGLSEALATYELSDTLLIVDPRHLPLRPDEFTSLLEHYSADPTVAHHLVVFERAVAGTMERVTVDGSGRVRKILRHYQPATWPFISGVVATLLPVASGLLADGTVPATLLQLRQSLSARGVPSRDVPVRAQAFDLTDEVGTLAASEHFVRKATAGAHSFTANAPTLVGSGQQIHQTARITGPVVIHRDVHIGEGATIVGPSVIGAGAEIGPGAVVAHALIGPDSVVRGNTSIRDRVWFDEVAVGDRVDHIRPTHSDTVPRAILESRSYAETPEGGRWRVSFDRGLFKRGLDLSVSFVLLAFLAPLLALASLAVWLESRGSIFYGDEREGVAGRSFRCWKFRTMYVGAHAAQTSFKALDKTDGPHFKIDNDPRVTRVGRLLRTLNVDELPQLFNVLMGEMSLVGPRPSPFRENQLCVPWREARLSVRPGITGFWQVCRHDRAAGDFHQWIEYDLLYVQYMSLSLDAKILFATLITLGGKVGHVPASWLVALPVQVPEGRPAMQGRGAASRPERLLSTQ